ncbi:hypothetical protein E6R60_26820 [Streptomyces sp. A0642]|uniref:hypothetical protein n=1 Tax=Streptomyces sp. A0642 TaxID=2563100 RepID=UPI0010A299CA|nr:hypothetical protein [Streptomyces sp. A0642]THA72544.1 hypothetical protein E6R60_26820 [Streptomyces sp. A0642]
MSDQRTDDLWAEDEPVREPMRPQTRSPRNPSRDDKRIRRRMRRSGAQEENSMANPDRSQLLQQIASATTVQEQMQYVARLDEVERAERLQAAQERELDLAQTSIGAAMTPLVSRTARGTMNSDWLLGLADQEVDHSALIAQAAFWFSGVPGGVRADVEEFEEQARGRARHVTASMGEQAPAAQKTFLDYATFLRTQSASGLDQVQQTTAPDGVSSKPTPLPPDVFDNFAPPVADINAGVTGTENSNQAPAIQQAVNGGGNSAPEVPGGHDSGGQMTGPAPEPSLGGGGGGSAPEEPGGHSETGEMGQSAEAPGPAAPPGQGPAAGSGGAQPYGDPRKQAASGLPQIQQTTDVHDAPAAQQLPTTVAFPWTLDEGVQADGMTGDAQYDQGGQVPSGHQSHASLRTRADQWTQPHPAVQPNIANSPASTPPRNVGEAGSGAADAADHNAQPSFGDAHAAPGYTGPYTSASPAAPAQNVPVSMGGDNGTSAKHPTYASRKVATREEMAHPDFQRGYKYAAKWAPGTPLVTPGSPELEAGIYAGLTDQPLQRTAWLAQHAELAKVEPRLGQRIAAHRQFTHRVAAEHALPTDGTYLSVEAATGIDLDTTNPTTSPSPAGNTPVNGPGQPGPLAGGMNAAAPAGAAPYNGAEPFGQPVVPAAPSVPQGAPVHIPDTGMASSAPAGQGLSAPMASFRRTVQAALLTESEGSR